MSQPTVFERASRLRSALLDRAPGAVAATWGVADQALSSLSNFILAIAVARQVTELDFGAFALAFGAYVFALNVSRAIGTDPLTIRHSGADDETWRLATANATGAAFAVGLLGLVACLALGLVIGSPVGRGVAVLGVGLPFLLTQDAWRYAFFAARRGRDAFLNDLVWTVVLGGSLAVLALSRVHDVDAFILAWAVGGAAGGAFGIWQAGVVPAPLALPHWARRHDDLIGRLTVEAVITGGAMPAALALIGFVAGVPATGAVRAGQVLLNALHIVTYGITMGAVPEAVRIARRSRTALARLCLAVAVGLAVITAAWGLVLLVLPSAVGQELLGASWNDARSVILPLTVGAIALAIQSAAVIGLRALALAQRSLRARAVTSIAFLAGGVAGALVGGGPGAAWGLAAGFIVGAAVWWLELARGLRGGVPTAVGGALAAAALPGPPEIVQLEQD